MEWTLKTRLLLMRYGMAEYESKIRNTTLQYECLQHRKAISITRIWKYDYKQMFTSKFWYSETWLFYIFTYFLMSTRLQSDMMLCKEKEPKII